ncbi:hypothetical protein O9992_12700 [Vibrio lentus]|nr:hypothetical protein [Vibrio lentus]
MAARRAAGYLGWPLNDTNSAFDRIRENFRKMRAKCPQVIEQLNHIEIRRTSITSARR